MGRGNALRLPCPPAITCPARLR